MFTSSTESSNLIVWGLLTAPVSPVPLFIIFS